MIILPGDVARASQSTKKRRREIVGRARKNDSSCAGFLNFIPDQRVESNPCFDLGIGHALAGVCELMQRVDTFGSTGFMISFEGRS